VRIFLNSPDAMVIGIAGGLALLITLYLILAQGPAKVPLERRRPAVPAGPGFLADAATSATGLLNRILRRQSSVGARVAALEKAGVKMRLQDVALLVIGATLAAAALGDLLAGPLIGLGLAVAVPLLAKFGVGALGTRRQRAFADQLDDSLQLLASSLRAGHSLLQALASVAGEAEAPTSEEFARIINENRVGRELSLALDECALRMDSEDFVWVTQAIAINREVGGNLAEVLDGVGNTIRERNQIRRQVKALSAEGKLSAYVLMALPLGIAGFLSFSNPEYMAKFVHSLAGYAMIGAAAVEFLVGGLWMRKVVQIKF
jgi:tight adherence protein B